MRYSSVSVYLDEFLKPNLGSVFFPCFVDLFQNKTDSTYILIVFIVILLRQLKLLWDVPWCLYIPFLKPKLKFLSPRSVGFKTSKQGWLNIWLHFGLLSTPLDGSVYFVTAPHICNFSPAALFIVLKPNKRCCNDPSPDRRSTSQIAFSRFQMNIDATSLVQWPTWKHYNLHSWRYSCRQSKTVSSLTLESNYWTQEHNICSLTFVRMNLFKITLLLLFANLSSGLQHRRCWLA